MWQVNLGNSILYYPANEDYAIFDTNLNEEVGLAGEFTFKVPPTNPLAESIAMGALVTILKDNREYWRGEIKELHTDFQKIIEVYCIEDLSWLGDEFLPPASIQNETYEQRFQAAIDAYNLNRPDERKFKKGYVSNISGTCNWTTEYEWSILDCLRECICQDDGYIRIRRQYENGAVARYVDIVLLSGYGKATSQPVEFGYNLLDFVKESDYGNLTNVLTPYGEELEDQEVYTDYAKRLQGTTITDSTSVNKYGRHAKSVIFDGITNVNSLNALARAYLARYSQPQLTMEVQAVDLGEIESIENIGIGDSVRIIAEPFGIDQLLYLTQLQRDLQDLSRNTLTLSGHVQKGRTLTSQTLQTAEMIENLPTKSSILEAAQKNALAMLLDSTQGGYVVFEYDSNDNMTAVNILNDMTIEGSTKRWRWSQNGFGYMSRPNDHSEWTGPTVAMTMNGAIVADFITTGTMSANRMRGGTLSLGGSSNGSYKNGSLYIYNEQDKVVGIWNKNGIVLYDGNGTASANIIGRWNTGGINITKGSINLGSGKFQVTNAGAVTASNISVTGGSIKLTKQSMTDSNNGLFLGTSGIALGKNNAFKVTNAGKLSSQGGNNEVVINGGEIEVKGSGNFTRWFSGNQQGGGYDYEIGINSQRSHGRRNDLGYYDECDSYKIIVAANNASDIRLKTNIKELSFEEAWAYLTASKPYSFNFKNNMPDKKRFGLIAQEFKAGLDEYGEDTENLWVLNKNLCDDMYCIEYPELVPHLIRVVTEQQKQINEMKEEINYMKGASNG